MIIAELRKYRLFDMAVFDWVATILGTLLLSRVLGTCFVGTLVVMIILAIIVHAVLKIPTMLNAYLGLAKKEDVYEKRTAAEAQILS